MAIECEICVNCVGSPTYCLYIYIHRVCIFDGINKSYLQDVKLKVLGDQSFRLAAVIY